MPKLNIFLLIAALAWLTGCPGIPKNEDDFRAQMMTKRSGFGHEVLTSKKSLAVIKRDTQEFARQCYNWQLIHKRSGAVGRQKYTQWGTHRPGYESFYIRESNQALNNIPGGFYEFIADLKSTGSGTTADVYFYDTYAYTFPAKFREIMAGQEPKCPN